MTCNYEGNRKLSIAIHSLTAGHFDGTVTGSFNYALEPMLDHIRAWWAGDIIRAMQKYVYDFNGRLHVRDKAATWLGGLADSPLMRAPMPKPRQGEVRALYQIFSKLNVSLIPEAEVEKVVALLD